MVLRTCNAQLLSSLSFKEKYTLTPLDWFLQSCVGLCAHCAVCRTTAIEQGFAGIISVLSVIPVIPTLALLRTGGIVTAIVVAIAGRTATVSEGASGPEAQWERLAPDCLVFLVELQLRRF